MLPTGMNDSIKSKSWSNNNRRMAFDHFARQTKVSKNYECLSML
jgi:hypothetical protein